MSASQNLAQLRTEVENHGFDDVQFGGSRIDQYINEAIGKATAKVQYYVDEAANDFNTVVGTTLYSLPTDFGKNRSLHFQTTSTFVGELEQVTLGTLDRSSATVTGVPRYYAFSGSNLLLYPTPDNVYALEQRYWAVPALLVNDGDEPTIPPEYQDMLIYWALKRGYASEDDQQQAAGWEAQWEKQLAAFASDVRFPSSQTPSVVASMWEGPPRLTSNGWRLT